jgi:hypothetical protein
MQNKFNVKIKGEAFGAKIAINVYKVPIICRVCCVYYIYSYHTKKWEKTRSRVLNASAAMALRCTMRAQKGFHILLLS